jgi:cell wall-associated NlpC family hydrolase
MFKVIFFISILVFTVNINTAENAVVQRYIIKASVLDVRAEPTNDSERVTQVLFNDRILVYEKQGNWSKVSIIDQKRDGNNYPGWVETDKIAPVNDFSYDQSTYVVINQPNTTLYENYYSPKRSKRVYLGTYLKYLGYIQDKKRTWAGKPVYWLECQTFDGEKGWVFYYHTEIIRGDTEKISIKSSSIANTSNQFLNTPYLWGGITNKGIDCSGFTYIVYRLNGYYIPRDADNQFNFGVPVDILNLESGDLVFFGRDGEVSHVGIYLGNGQIIHAGMDSGVSYDNLLTQSLFNRYIGARRIVHHQ